jgi:hypothetical protein
MRQVSISPTRLSDHAYRCRAKDHGDDPLLDTGRQQSPLIDSGRCEAAMAQGHLSVIVILVGHIRSHRVSYLFLDRLGHLPPIQLNVI